MDTNDIFREKLDKYKDIQKEMDALFQPILKKLCPTCEHLCCHKLPKDIDFDLKLAKLSGLFLVKSLKESCCPYLGDDGCNLQGLKPMICEVHTCDKLTNEMLKQSSISVFNILAKNLKINHRELRGLI